MKKKLSLFLVILMALTMVMGIGVSAMAAEPRTVKVSQMNSGDYTFPFTIFNDTADTVYVRSDGSSYIELSLSNSGDDFSIVAGGQFTIGDNEWSGRTVSLTFNPFYANSPNTSEPAAPAHIHDFKWQTITEPTKDTDGLEGEVCSCGAMRNTQPISAMAYVINEYATQMIKAAKPGQKITLEFGEFNSFPRYMMEKIAARMNENITFVFKFKQNKKMQTITIEPGTTIDLQYDWYGPDKMAELYGAN